MSYVTLVGVISLCFEESHCPRRLEEKAYDTPADVQSQDVDGEKKTRHMQD